jgi:hypothetical protein
VESVRNQPKSAERQQNAIQITRKANKIRENSGNKTSGFTVFQQTAKAVPGRYESAGFPKGYG